MQKGVFERLSKVYASDKAVSCALILGIFKRIVVDLLFYTMTI